MQLAQFPFLPTHLHDPGTVQPSKPAMPTGLAELPVEIFDAVIQQPCLSRSDLCNIARVCKSFHRTTQVYIEKGGDLTFKILNTGLFHFLRRLLADETFGQRFTSLKLLWDPAASDEALAEENRLMEQCKWTDEEIAQLGKIASKHKVQDNTRVVIQTLKTGDSLVVPILCLLPNLQSFDLGEPVCFMEDLVQYSDCMDTLIDDYITRLIWIWGRDIEDRDKFFGPFAPGLMNLRVFKKQFTVEGSVGFDIDNMTAIFLLPNIEEVYLTKCGGELLEVERFADAGYRSNVKIVEINQFECTNLQVARFIQFCTALEVVRIDLQMIGFELIGHNSELSVSPIQECLLELHEETLKEVVLTGNGGLWRYKACKNGEVEEEFEESDSDEDLSDDDGDDNQVGTR